MNTHDHGFLLPGPGFGAENDTLYIDRKPEMYSLWLWIPRSVFHLTVTYIQSILFLSGLYTSLVSFSFCRPTPFIASLGEIHELECMHVILETDELRQAEAKIKGRS